MPLRANFTSTQNFDSFPQKNEKSQNPHPFQQLLISKKIKNTQMVASFFSKMLVFVIKNVNFIILLDLEAFYGRSIAKKKSFSSF